MSDTEKQGRSYKPPVTMRDIRETIASFRSSIEDNLADKVSYYLTSKILALGGKLKPKTRSDYRTIADAITFTEDWLEVRAEVERPESKAIRAALRPLRRRLEDELWK